MRDLLEVLREGDPRLYREVLKAAALRQERMRRGQHNGLLDCLQLSDKGQVLVERPEILRFLGFGSKRTAKAISMELDSLGNNLAHGQDIVTHDGAAIARIAPRIEDASEAGYGRGS